jgi:hypothetical protein
MNGILISSSEDEGKTKLETLDSLFAFQAALQGHSSFKVNPSNNEFSPVCPRRLNISFA